MFTFSDSFLSEELSGISDKILKAQYYAGNTWYDAAVTKTVEEGKLNISFQIGLTTGTDLNVSKVRLLGTGNTVIAETKTVIMKSSVSETVDYKAQLDIFGVAKNKTQTGEYDKQ